MMKIRLAFAPALACATAAVLAACGGGGDGSRAGPTEIERARQDPRVVRLGGIIERAGALVVPAAYHDLAVTARGRTERVFLPMSGSCEGPSCTLRGGGESVTTALHDLLIPSGGAAVTGISLGRRQGFDTVLVTGHARFDEGLYGGSAAASLSARSYGMWGRHGFAAADVMEGSFSGVAQGVPFEGSVRGARSFTVGTPAGSNPTGSGGASWSGPAEAVSTRSWKRLSGMATVTMADLSVPLVAVDVKVGGRSIGSSGWNGIRLDNGRFGTGTAGVDRLAGDFHGPEHEEAYGAFDTGAFVGSFGAKR